MEPKYTAQAIKDEPNGWVLTETATGKTHVVFCSPSANAAEDAVRVLEEAQNPTDAE